MPKKEFSKTGGAVVCVGFGVKAVKNPQYMPLEDNTMDNDIEGERSKL